MDKNIYNANEISKLFKNNKKETKKFRLFLSEKYKQDFNDMNDDMLIEWYFKDYSKYDFNELYLYVKCDKDIADFVFKNNYYLKVTIYKHDSNLDYCTFSIGKHKKDYLTIEEAKEKYQDCIKSNLIKLPKTLKKREFKSLSTKFRTEDNFYGNYIENGNEYCLGTFSYGISNLGICSITLSGNDDYSITQDFYSYSEAIKKWNKLKNKKFVNKDDLPDSYFSN